MGTVIDPSAHVHPKAEIGENVTIGPGCVIEADTVIGDETRLDPYAQIRAFTKLGKGNRVHSYACVGGEPQDLKFHGEESWLEIGDKNNIREFVTIHRGTEGGGGLTKIGSGCLLMAYVHVAHDCIIGDNVILSNGAMLAGHVELGNYSAVGGMSGVHQFTRIGEHTFIGAMSGVAQDVPPYTLAVGARATLRGLNIIGLKRYDFSQEALSALKKVYKIIFRSGTVRREALTEAESQYSGIPEVENFIGFIRSSERGVSSDSARSAEEGLEG